MPKKKTEVLVFPQYWKRYGGMDSNVVIAARRAWTFGVLQTQRIYLPVVQENEKLKKELAELKSRRTKRAPDVCPSCAGEKQVIGEDGTVWVCGICGGTGKRR